MRTGSSVSELTSRRSPGSREGLARLYCVLIVLGSPVLVAIPLVGISLLAAVGSTSLWPYLGVLATAGAAMVGWGGLLTWLDRRRAMLIGDRRAGLLPVCVSAAVLVAILVVIAWAVLIAGNGADIRGPFPD